MKAYALLLLLTTTCFGSDTPTLKRRTVPPALMPESCPEHIAHQRARFFTVYSNIKDPDVRKQLALLIAHLDDPRIVVYTCASRSRVHNIDIMVSLSEYVWSIEQ
jgi:hypothetical protein